MYVTTDQSVYYLLFPKYMKKKWFANLNITLKIYSVLTFKDLERRIVAKQF